MIKKNQGVRGGVELFITKKDYGVRPRRKGGEYG